MDEDKYKDQDFIGIVNKLKIEPGDVLIFRIPRNFNPPQERLKELVRYVHNFGGYVLFAAKDIEIEKYTEEQMAKMGWIRKEKCK